LAISLLIFLLPSYLIRFQVGPLPSTLLEVMIWLVFLVWFIANFYELKTNVRESLRRLVGKSADGRIKIEYPFSREIIFLLIISFVATGVSGFSNSALGIWKAYFFDPILLYIVVLNVFGSSVILNKPRTQSEGSEESIIHEQTNYRSFAIAQDDKISRILWPLCLSALAVALLAIYQEITGNLIDNPFWAAAATRRAVSFFGYPNAVGLYLGPLSLILFGYIIYLVKDAVTGLKIFNFQFSIFKQFSIFNFQTIKIIFLFFTIVFSFLAIIFAKSAGAILGVVAGLAVFCLLASKRTRIAVIVIITLAAIGCAAVPLTRHSVLDKLMLRDFSGTVRRIGWNDTWKMLSDGRLIFGAGLANFQKTVAPYHQRGFFVSDGTQDFWERLATDTALRDRSWQPLEIYLYPHNIFLNFWSELGLVGMILFIWMIGKFFYVAFKNIENCKLPPPWRGPAVAGKIENLNDSKSIKYLIIGLISSMVTIVIHGLVDVPYFKNDLAVMFWLFIAMLSLINNYQTKNSL
jgi:O-antigen ligase